MTIIVGIAKHDEEAALAARCSQMNVNNLNERIKLFAKLAPIDDNGDDDADDGRV